MYFPTQQLSHILKMNNCGENSLKEVFQWNPNSPYCVLLFYKYVEISDVIKTYEYFEKTLNEHNLLGRVLISSEGVNGSLAGNEHSILSWIKCFESLNILGKVDWKFSSGIGESLPFVDLHLKIVNQIISVGDANEVISKHVEFDENSFGGLKGGGLHLSPSQFHQGLISNENKIILDIRNDFEYQIGHFEGAQRLNTNVYSETWSKLDSLLPDLTVDKSDTNHDENINVYMYCTGGIRCEKASAYLLNKGYKNVYQVIYMILIIITLINY